MSTATPEPHISTAAARHSTFAALFAIAILFQLASVMWIVLCLYRSPPEPSGVCELMLMCACIALLLRPASKRWLLAVAALQLIDSWLSLPHMPNHRFVTSCVSIGILLAYSSRRPAGQCFLMLAPALRASAVVVYFFAVFHKLNSAFFDPVASCASVFTAHIRMYAPFFPEHPALIQALPFLTLLAEGGVALLVLRRKTRPFGLLIALVFHSILTLDVDMHFFDFSSTMFALLSAFLPDRFFEGPARDAAASRWRALRAPFIVGYLVSMLGAFLTFDTSFGYGLFFSGRQLLWWLLNLQLFATFLRLMRGGWTAHEALSMKVAPRIALVPLILFLNGLTPYFGLKTRSSLDMYSNLRAERGYENHFLVRRSIDLLGHTADTAEVVATSDAELDGAVRTPGFLTTFFELRRFVSANPEMSLTYRRNGIERTLSRAGDDPELEPPPYLLSKLLWYRPIDPGSPSRCQW